MKVSVSIDLVLQLAAQEAVVHQFKEIGPEHLFMAVLKFSELPAKDLNKIVPDSHVSKDLERETSAVNDELKRLSIDSTKVRRSLRANFSKGNTPYDGGHIHRSQVSKDLFNKAAGLANERGDDIFTAEVLLEAILASPTPAIERELGPGSWREPRPSSTPLLDEHGRDVGQIVVKRKISPVTNRKAESKVLVNALEQKDHQNIFLISDSVATGFSVIVASVARIAEKDVSAGLKGKRIIDLTEEKSTDKPLVEDRELLGKLISEASTSNKIILVLPEMKTIQETKKLVDWYSFIKTELKKKPTSSICIIGPSVYKKHIEKDDEWKALSRSIWIREKNTSEIPTEL